MEKNLDCPCTEDCKRWSICKECQVYHHKLEQKTCCGK